MRIECETGREEMKEPRRYGQDDADGAGSCQVCEKRRRLGFLIGGAVNDTSTPLMH